MADCSDDILNVIELVGAATLVTLKILKSLNLLRANSPIKDLGLVAGLLLNVIRDWPGDPNEPQFLWVIDMVKLLLSAGVKLADVPFGVEKVVAELVLDDDDEDSPDPTPEYWDGLVRLAFL